MADNQSSSEPQNMEEEIVEIQAVSLTDEVNAEFHRHKLEYHCSFYLSPETQEYYSTTPALEVVNANKNGRPILLGSPIFMGPMNTKWRVSTSFNHWIGTERWLPIFLTRDDNEQIPRTNLSIQCEMRIVDTQRNILKSMKSKTVGSASGTSQGFNKFLPFQRIKEFLTDNWLHVEAHLTIFCKIETNLNQQQRLKPLKLAPQVFDGGNNVEAYDRVELFANGDFIGFLSRKALREKSLTYGFQIENGKLSLGYDEKMQPNNEENHSPRLDQSIFQSFLMYVNTGQCSILDDGSFQQKFYLFQLGLHGKILDLLKRCMKSIFSKLTVEDASWQAVMLKQYPEFVETATFERFRRFYRENIKEIQNDPLSEYLLEFKSDYLFLLRLAIHPGLDHD